MFFASAVFGAALAAIPLDGATGGDLRAVAAFDVNNAFVGDPLELTIDFIGEADFRSLHPPALSREVDRSAWRIDDAGAKTETYRDARRLKYRVRPLKEGLLVFPALEFSYARAGGGTGSVSTAPVPVHAKAGAQVALAESGESGGGAPMPDGIFVSLENSPWGTSPDEETLFAWRKACSAPDAAAFAAFDFPEARFNEAACEIAAGNWAKALAIYSVLEWRTGQTPAMERGIAAALALKTSGAETELPMWRRAFRPVLRYGWAGRALCVAAAFALVALLLALARRVVRTVACVAAVFAALEAAAYDPFEEMDRHFREMQRQMRRGMEEMTMSLGGGNGSVSFSFGGEQQEPVKIAATVKPDRTDIKTGEEFNLVISLDMPKSCTIEDQRLSCSQMVGLSSAGASYLLEDGVSADTNRVVRRTAVPVRYDAPFKGVVSFSVSGRYVARTRLSRGGSFFGTSTASADFTADAPKIWMEVKPLSAEGQPADFSGAVGTGFKMRQTADMYSVETNDVVKVECVLEYKGYVPPDALPGETVRGDGRIRTLRYFVADGAETTGDVDFCWYDTDAKDYKRLKSRGMRLSYKAPGEGGDAAGGKVVVNAGAGESGAVFLKFSPRDDAPDVAPLRAGKGELPVLERHGGWVRVDDGFHAGWLRREDAE